MKKVGRKRCFTRYAIVLTRVLTGISLLSFGSVNRIYASDIFEKAASISGTLKDKIVGTYTSALFPLLFTVDLLCLAITKDEKKLAKEKEALKWLIIIYVGMQLITVISNTVQAYFS